MTPHHLLFLVFMIHHCESSGYFEIQILSIVNSRGETTDGSCCGSRGISRDDRTCHGTCDTLFRVCLKQYQSQVTFDDQCTFGNKSTKVICENSFDSAGTNMTEATLKIPFQFSWTRSYTLIVTAWDRGSVIAPDRLIERSAYSGIILPGRSWHTLTHNGPTASLVYRIRVLCDDHYYNTTCSMFCRPRDDRLGHYTCNDNGDKVCLEGWLGSQCDIAICRTGCHALHGSCDEPGECRCLYGWKGDLCDQCIPYPGCEHGSCNNSPWTCNCHIKWGSQLCDKDLNTCRHHPCENHGLCMNTAPDNYTCSCPHGFSGTNCEIAEDPCLTDPCQNFGTCIVTVTSGRSFVCHCEQGWTGELCEIDIDECASEPCQNGGRCEDELAGYKCMCAPGWRGPQCQLDADECSGSPCENAHTCHDHVGDYTCECMAGWAGKNCDFNINDCHGQCIHGRCLDLVDDYFCVCPPGYDGENCQHVVNDCDSSPCLQGGTCTNLVPGYTCQCPDGYSGYNCEIDVDPCNPSPCLHESTCYVTEDDYFCYCPDSYTGKHCEVPRVVPTNNIDSCTISIPSNYSVGGVQLISSGICGKHGMCISKPGGAFECSCASGFTGEFCHENIDDCSRHPCQNSGTCVDLVNAFQCICTEGWEGALCNINKNECDPNPCRNHGKCNDEVAGYVCQCVDDWKGKTCTLTSSQCDEFTCANGGSCVDIGGTFACKCPKGWEGTTCHTPTSRACDSAICENNGTCVNSGDSFTCICKEGFEGYKCQSNVNDCNPFPCYNGGECIDGINRYVCQCAPGFTGPDCRVNINECLSSPCTYGSTCIDGIGQYRCICPPERSGDHCEKIRGRPPIPQSCELNRRTHPHNSTWEHDCHVCTCNDGNITCTEVKCGPKTCAEHSGNYTTRATPCAKHETCVIQEKVTCFTPPCLPWGKCIPKDEARTSAVPIRQVLCVHDPQIQAGNCARIMLVFDKTKIPLGVSVEGVCSTIQRISGSPVGANVSEVYITCEVQSAQTNTIEVFMSVDHEADEKFGQLRDVVVLVANTISHKQTDNQALAAVVEVKVETTLVDEAYNKGPMYLVPLLCSIIVLIGGMVLAVVIFWHRRRQRSIDRWVLASNLSDEKANNDNIDNFHNLRRYKNPLYDKDKIGAPTNLRPLEMHDVDRYHELEADEGSPTQLLWNEDILSPDNGWSDHVTMRPRIKDINIALHKSRSRPYRNDMGHTFPDMGMDDTEIVV